MRTAYSTRPSRAMNANAFIIAAKTAVKAFSTALQKSLPAVNSGVMATILILVAGGSGCCVRPASIAGVKVQPDASLPVPAEVAHSAPELLGSVRRAYEARATYGDFGNVHIDGDDGAPSLHVRF